MTALRSILLASAAGSLLFSSQAWAEDDGARINALEARIADQDRRIAELERLVLAAAANATAAAHPEAHVPVGTPGTAVAGSVAGATPIGPIGAATAPAQATAPSRLAIAGDFRLREEFNWSDADARDRTRTVMRARLRANYALNDKLTLGASLVTGDPDDPNTTDLTLGDFDDDLTVALDQIFIRYRTGNLTLWGGKFPNPFRRTDLVWDGDVNPEGLSATYAMPLGGGATAELRTLYFMLSESVAGKGSDMLGGQLGLTVPVGNWGLDLSAAYYDYNLRDVAAADAGDFRSNLMRGGRYLSDFNLGDVLGTVTYRGLGARWPIGLTGEYVHNFGAAVDADDGYSIELFAGRAASRGDWRVAYNYMAAQNEAVFAAFSHDNLMLATNYKLHALSIDHVLRPNTILNLTAYHYRPDDPLYAGTHDARDWLNRVRLNLLFNF